MSTLRQSLALVLLVGLCALRAPAQPVTAPVASPSLPDVQKLTEALASALNGSDPGAAVSFFHPDCLVTWADTETSRGHDGLRAFHRAMLGGPVKRVERFACEVRVDDAVQLFAGGQAALAAGGFNERFQRPGGRKLDLQGRWSAVLVPSGDRWLIANLHVSTDPFNNSVLNMARQAGWVVGVVSLLVGAGIGWLLGRKKRAARQT